MSVHVLGSPVVGVIGHYVGVGNDNISVDYLVGDFFTNVDVCLS